MVLSQVDFYNEIIWKCFLCGKVGRLVYGISFDSENSEEVNYEISRGHRKVSEDHNKISPFCFPIGTKYFDFIIEQLPAGYQLTKKATLIF